MLIEYKIKELAIDRKYNSTVCNNRYLFPTLKDRLFIIYMFSINVRKIFFVINSLFCILIDFINFMYVKLLIHVCYKNICIV